MTSTAAPSRPRPARDFPLRPLVVAIPVLTGVLGSVLPTAVFAQTGAPLVAVHAMLPVPTPFTPEVSLSGEIQARVQSNVAFRLNGKVTERRVEVGEHVTADQVLAVLDPTEQKADVDNAQAGVKAAEAQLQQASTSFERQKTLLASGFTTRASYDQADETLKTSQAQLDSARATLSTAKEQLTYAELKAGTAGIVVSRDVEAGQVVQAGQTVFVIAQDGPRDAVFNIYEALLTKPPRDRKVDVILQADPAVRTVGTVREISPTVDPATATVKVKIGLDETPAQMTLGAAVVGHGRWEQTSAIVLPWSALFEWDGKPAVWLLDDADVATPKTIAVAAYATGSVILAGGLDGKQRVVTAGIQLLHIGQKVSVVTGGGL